MARRKPLRPAKAAITSDTSKCRHEQYRSGVYNCPHCDFTPTDGAENCFWWHGHAHTLVLGVVYGKGRSLVTITECPKCFENSWQHTIPLIIKHAGCGKRWVAAADKEMERRRALAEVQP